jgi:hypothetical protein
VEPIVGTEMTEELRGIHHVAQNVLKETMRDAVRAALLPDLLRDPSGPARGV